MQNSELCVHPEIFLSPQSTSTMWNHLRFPPCVAVAIATGFNRFLFPQSQRWPCPAGAEGRLWHQLSKHRGVFALPDPAKTFNSSPTSFEGNADSSPTFISLIKQQEKTKKLTNNNNKKILSSRYLGSRTTSAGSCRLQRYVCTKGTISGC